MYFWWRKCTNFRQLKSIQQTLENIFINYNSGCIQIFKGNTFELYEDNLDYSKKLCAYYSVNNNDLNVYYVKNNTPNKDIENLNKKSWKQ